MKPGKIVNVFILSLLVMLLVACSLSTPTPIPTVTPPRSEPDILTNPDMLTVTSASAGVVTNVTGASIAIPAGAVPVNDDGSIGSMVFSITHDPATVPSLPGGFVQVGPVFSLGPEGSVFDQPVTISLPIPSNIDTGTVAGGAYFNAGQGAWALVPGSVDVSTRTVQVSTTHLSTWMAYGFPVDGSTLGQDPGYPPADVDTGGYFNITRPSSGTDYGGPGAIYRGSATAWHGVCVQSAVYDDPDVANWWLPPLEYTMKVDNYWGGYGSPGWSPSGKYWLPNGSYQAVEFVGQSEYNPGDPLYIPKYYTMWRELGTVSVSAGGTVEFPDPSVPYGAVGWTVSIPPCWEVPSEPAGPVAVYQSVSFDAGLTQGQAVYPQALSLCVQMPPGASGCMITYDPCPSTGGGGGGGGGGGDVACLIMPDYCYSCMPDYGAQFFYDLVDPDRNPITWSTTHFQIDVASDGTVINFGWGASYLGENPTLVELTSEPGNFHTRWNLWPPNLPDHNPGYIIVDGSNISFDVTSYDIGEGRFEYQVKNLQGSGTWELGHPLFGTTATGTWQFDTPNYWYQVNP